MFRVLQVIRVIQAVLVSMVFLVEHLVILVLADTQVFRVIRVQVLVVILANRALLVILVRTL